MDKIICPAMCESSFESDVATRIRPASSEEYVQFEEAFFRDLVNYGENILKSGDASQQRSFKFLIHNPDACTALMEKTRQSWMAWGQQLCIQRRTKAIGCTISSLMPAIDSDLPYDKNPNESSSQNNLTVNADALSVLAAPQYGLQRNHPYTATAKAQPNSQQRKRGLPYMREKRPYRCPIYALDKEAYRQCSKTVFESQSKWKDHILIHFRLHTCSTCKRRFSKIGNAQTCCGGPHTPHQASLPPDVGAFIDFIKNKLEDRSWEEVLVELQKLGNLKQVLFAAGERTKKNASATTHIECHEEDVHAFYTSTNPGDITFRVGSQATVDDMRCDPDGDKDLGCKHLTFQPAAQLNPRVPQQHLPQSPSFPWSNDAVAGGPSTGLNPSSEDPVFHQPLGISQRNNGLGLNPQIPASSPHPSFNGGHWHDPASYFPHPGGMPGIQQALMSVSNGIVIANRVSALPYQSASEFTSSTHSQSPNFYEVPPAWPPPPSQIANFHPGYGASAPHACDNPSEQLANAYQPYPER